MKAEKVLKGCKIYVWKETFDFFKSKKYYETAFSNIIDKNGITVITEQDKYNKDDVIKIEKGWKIITFDVFLEYGLVGFLSKIAKALADENISILAISAYSIDHILVKEKDIEKAVKALQKLGCVLK